MSDKYNLFNIDRVLCKESIQESSKALNHCFSNPLENVPFSIDGIAITVPIGSTERKKMYHIHRIIESETGLLCRNIRLDGKEAGAAQYLNRIEVCNAERNTISVLWKGLSDKHRQLKLDINPYTFGFESSRQVIEVISKVLGPYNYRDLIYRSNITSIFYAMDFLNVYIGHFLPLYAYRSPFTPYVNSAIKSFTGWQYGNKSQCPTKGYNKALEQGGEFLGVDTVTRLEKLHRPRMRHEFDFTVANMLNKTHRFQGLNFYDPKILLRMPPSVARKVLWYGVEKAIDILEGKDHRILAKRAKKSQIHLGIHQRQMIGEGFSKQISRIQDLLLLRNCP